MSLMKHVLLVWTSDMISQCHPYVFMTQYLHCYVLLKLTDS